MKQLMKTIARTLLRFAQSKTCMLMLVAVLAAFVLPGLAHAAPPTVTDAGEDVEKKIAELLSIMMNFLNALLWPFLLIIGDLMDTDLILGPGMEERLKGIWIPVRDLVNIGFVLVLLVVAFYNVLGLGGGEGELALKTALPKIVLGLVLVNFTFIAGKVALDLVNVATTAAFALPELAASDETLYNFSAVKDEFQAQVCYKPATESGVPTYYNTGIDKDNIPIYTRLFCEEDDEGTYRELDGLLAAKYFTNLNANNIGLIMAVNMGGLSNLSVLKPEGITSFSDLTISILFALIMYLVFATSYLVLGIVLLTRLVVLWIALALSPLIVLVYVVPQIKEWLGGGGDFAKKIVKHLMAPVIIGLTMSLGYIMIAAWDGLTGNAALGSGFQANQVMSTEFLVNGIDDLPQFIIALASIIIVWTGVFAAANDTYASFATEAIKGFGNRIRDAAVKSSLLIPSVVVGYKDGQAQTTSFAALKGLADSGLRRIEYGEPAQAQMQKLADSNPIAKLLLGNQRGGTADPRQNAEEINRILGSTTEGKIDAAQMADLASRMSSIYLAHDKESNSKEMQRIQKIFANPKSEPYQRQTALREFQGMVGKPDEDLEKSLEGEFGRIKRGVGRLRTVTPGTPTGGALPETTQLPSPMVTEARNHLDALTNALAAAGAAGATPAQIQAAHEALTSAQESVPKASMQALTDELAALTTRVNGLPPAAPAASPVPPPAPAGPVPPPAPAAPAGPAVP